MIVFSIVAKRRFEITKETDMNNKPDKPEKKESLTKTNLAKRQGWSLALIKKLLGEPDEIKHNFIYGGELYLYHMERILQVEQTDEFKNAQESLLKRKTSAKKVAQRKTDELIEQVNNMVINVRFLENKVLQKRAIKSYNEWNLQKSYDRGHYDFDTCDENSNPEFLERITVNYIRHNLTDYDYALYETIGKVGRKDAILLITKKIFDAIATVYPRYSDECARQLNRKNILITV